ncbi:uncharacterized protein J7T54_007081 [Emericellopsis cladophorae]|uniref:Major facilitator superfamily (MFS) profile domain-containing protein n=1 Tax=Emericellopsis cladophorae TaxID=2686198 RepID=A0A9P9Y8D1_9HYPO|nr:uncharacterized protein J7T54_007081 [Emericellopsis cladophorae]KAI6785439.1 hypothetical protein J7T54_007081 [Emericellopsis cladophorae]
MPVTKDSPSEASVLDSNAMVPPGSTAEGGPVSTPQDRKWSIHSPWAKRGIVLCSAMTAFFSPFSSQIYLPAMTSIASDLDLSISQVNLTVTTYIVTQAILPMFVGPLADTFGRRPAYLVCGLIFIAANMGLAEAPNYAALLVLRSLQSAGSSPTVTLCGAVIADVATSAERGTYASITGIPTVLGPALGPVVGGLVSQNLGWRWIFWVLTILAGVSLLIILLFLPETCRALVDDGSVAPQKLSRTAWQWAAERRGTGNSYTEHPQQREERTKKPVMASILGNFAMLWEKETGLLLGSGCLLFAAYTGLTTALATNFAQAYDLSPTDTGLMYLPMVAGTLLGAVLAGPMMTWNYKRQCARQGVPYDRSRQIDLLGFPIERVRLEIGIPFLATSGVAIMAWGWAVQSRVHLAAPCSISAVVGLGMTVFNNTIWALLMDIHTARAGTATAGANLGRGLVSAATAAFIAPAIDGLGMGWTFTVLAIPYAVVVPVMWYVMANGMRWRAQQVQVVEGHALSAK